MAAFCRCSDRSRRPRSYPFGSPEVLEGRALTSAARDGASAGVSPVARHLAETSQLTTAPPSSPGPTGGKAGGVRAITDIVYRNDHGRQVHLDLYLPTGPTPAGGHPAILGLPGGGWRWIRRNALGDTLSSFARDGYVVAVADYTFASSRPGTHVWPTNFEDVRAAVRWLKTNAQTYGINPDKIAAWGESAGAHLANLLGTDPDGPLTDASGSTTPDPTSGSVSARVAAVVDFYGPTNLAALYQESTKDRSYLDTFLGGSPDQVPQRYKDASPVNHVTPAAPPFLIFQGTADTANLPDQSAQLDQALTRAGVPHLTTFFPKFPHGFRLTLGHGVSLRPEVLWFLDATLNHPAPKPAH